MTTTQTTISLDEVIAKVESIVAERPNKMAQCYYTVQYSNGLPTDEIYPEDVVPECIIGKYIFDVFGAEYLLAFGQMPLVAWYDFHNGTPGKLMRNSAADRLVEAGIDPKGVRFLSLMQWHQDAAYTDWNKALELTKKVFEETEARATNV